MQILISAYPIRCAHFAALPFAALIAANVEHVLAQAVAGTGCEQRHLRCCCIVDAGDDACSGTSCKLQLGPVSSVALPEQ